MTGQVLAKGQNAPLAAQRPVKGRNALSEAVDRLTIVALDLIGCAKEGVRVRGQDDIPARRGKREGALGSANGLVIRTAELEMA